MQTKRASCNFLLPACWSTSLIQQIHEDGSFEGWHEAVDGHTVLHSRHHQGDFGEGVNCE